ncbi:hypothetical protein C7T94_05900 [Pedobacter yulinensis]|uniref:Uncharacterized protein n=1 Tax=Pedobacter yulinensis TaxID=2126353 RepID=A0A2T3HP85_9SPHI|nr:hypothetical protein [Pedobacter yulinensis]PST84252.1 hypothetical protein C7T94_05900 [Pedobacter yulinensis]
MKIKNQLLAFLFIVSVTWGCSVTRDWAGTSNENESYASFSSFNGTQKFRLVLPANKQTSQVAYKADVQSGQLQLQITQGRTVLLDKAVSGSASGQLPVRVAAGKEVELTLTGQAAKGAYRVEVLK